MAYSSNVGTTRVYDRLGAAPLATILARFRLSVPDDFGQRSGRDAQLAYGALLEASSLDVAAGYLVVARGGTWPDGQVVISPTTATQALGLLEAAVAREDATGHPAAVEGVRVAGKTGTVRVEDGTFGVFVGIFPVEAPRYVVLVGVEAGGEGHSGSTLAAPSFVRIARELL
jgi:cell division protein FtsI (penicillin-binding protein 3)